MATAAAAPQAVPAPAAQRAHNNSSLYVGDLPSDVTEAILYEIFNSVGPVASIRVCRDAVTRRSLGYAYVNFQTPTDAERAIDAYNYTPILGRPCRIMWSQRDPVLRRSGTGNVFINGLDKEIELKELHDAFSIFGDILSCKIVVDETGRSIGRGFVHFATAQAAEAAIAQCNGTMLGPSKISVAHFKSRKERLEESSRAEQQFKNVYVKNLPEDFTEEELKNLFVPFGTITSMIVMRDTEGKTRCFGFVNFTETSEAKDAVETLNGKEVNGKILFVGRAMKKSERRAVLQRDRDNRRRDLQERSKGVNLYVKNLSENIDDAKFRQLFDSFGPISSSRIMRDERGNSRGFGFVSFNDAADATRAVSEMNTRLQDGKPLYVALAQNKDERRQQLAAKHRQRMMAQRNTGGIPPYMAQGMYPQMMFAGPFPGARANFQQQSAYGRFAQSMPVRFPGMNMPPQPFPFTPRGPQMAMRQSRPNARGPNGAAPAPGNQARGMPRQQAPNPRYNAAARNAAAQVPVAETVPAQGPVNLASELAAADPERQKQILGDHLYSNIVHYFPDLAGKLTGMLLQMDNSDLLQLIDDPVALRAEVDKAQEALLQHQVQQVPEITA